MKHAFLVPAYCQFEILAKTLDLFDDKNIDFYIHIDKKTKNVNYDLLNNSVKKSHIYYIDRQNIYWGDYSQAECTIRLLKESTLKKYDYYHLLSGNDLPIKTKNYFLNFFNKNNGYEFVGFESEKIKEKRLDRLKYHHLMHFKNKKIRYFFEFVPKIESIIGINRIKNVNLEFQYGSNWFSITHDFALYIISNEELIHKIFKNTYACDELYIQTMLFNSPFKKNLYKSNGPLYLNNMRLVDWKRAKPYTWRIGDFDELMSSDCLFARKFNMNVDNEIINKVYNTIKTKQKLNKQ